MNCALRTVEVVSSRGSPLAVFTRNPILFDPISRRPRAVVHSLKAASLCVAACLLGFLAGCGRFRQQQYETVYVSARHMYLHDRVAAVSERVAEVSNGDRLQVLERGRRFIKVKTEKNQIGWIEQRAVIDSKTYDGFIEMAKVHRDDPVTATATLRDDLYMHLLPGRKTENFYLLPGNGKVQLLARATVSRDSTPVSAAKPPAPKPPVVAPKTNLPGKPQLPAGKLAGPAIPPAAPIEAPPVIMEDWWLVRDSQGRTGWLLGNRLDVDVPEEIMQYGEGQRFIGSWVLTRVTDPEAATPDHQVAEYLTVMSPLGSGLPYDFDDVRVFTWSLKHHRYETAFRLHPIKGFLPLRLSTQAVSSKDGRIVPTFSFQIAGSDNVAIDQTTGISHPANPRTIRYQMIDTRVMRIGPDMAPIPVNHDGDKKAKEKKAAKAKAAAKKGRR